MRGSSVSRSILGERPFHLIGGAKRRRPLTPRMPTARGRDRERHRDYAGGLRIAPTDRAWVVKE